MSSRSLRDGQAGPQQGVEHEAVEAEGLGMQRKGWETVFVEPLPPIIGLERKGRWSEVQEGNWSQWSRSDGPRSLD